MIIAIALALQASTFQAGLVKDAEILQQAYESMHPGLYRYNTKAQMERNFAQLRSDWAACQDLKQAYLALSEFTAKIKCGHTYPNFFNQDKEVVQTLFAGNSRVPFYFRWLDRKMIVLRDFTDDGRLPRGSEIEAINGIPCGQILKRLLEVARADGSNDHKRYSYLSVTGDDRFEAFDIYLPLYFKIPDGRFTFRVRDLVGAVRKVSTRALSMESRMAAYRAKTSAQGQREPWSLALSGPTATLTMPSWQMYTSSWDWPGYLRQVFTRLHSEGTKNLIIDLRGNEGGSSVGDVLAGYLTARPLDSAPYHEYTRYKKVDPSLRAALDTWDRSFDDWSPWTPEPPQEITVGRNRFYRMTRFDGEGKATILPEAQRFTGKVFVLVDSSNSSATFEFENLVQSNHLAILVGEPTGGNLRGINGGAFYFLHLPNSKLEVDLPLIAQFPSMPQPDRGLRPDIPITPSRADIAAGRDVVLHRVAELIAKGETRSAYNP